MEVPAEVAAQANAMLAELQAQVNTLSGRCATLAGDKAILTHQLEQAVKQLAEMSKPSG